jgi:isoleucyl-tRNA synthetase
MNTKKEKTAQAEREKSEVALREEAILAFWQEHDIFKKSLEALAGAPPKGDYVFYDGPPFATGLPHYGHILAGTMKDAIPRFWTMSGYRVRRQWGWDCHGLPVENLIEKKLGLATKRDIEEYGVQKFNEAARDSVLEYADDWREIIPRLGRFVDMKDDYKTMDSSYTESVWWVFKQLHEKGLVYEGFKSMHLCPRCGTTLSNFEVNQGYKDIKDISVTVKLPLLDAAGNPTGTSLLVWTTTPWTLPGNLAAAVNQDAEYVRAIVLDKTSSGTPFVPEKREYVILAKDSLFNFSDYENYSLEVDGRPVETWCSLGDKDFGLIGEFKGEELLGKKYEPPFPWLKEQSFEGKENAWTIYHGDFVQVGEGAEGTGAVHIAPAFGEDDMQLAKEHGVPIIHHVDENGHFKSFVADFAGKLVKPKDVPESDINHMDADIEVIKALAARGKLFAKEKITHSYPHCWRCETPLLNYATTSWFVDVPALKDKLVAANNTVRWVPEHVGKNRFGKWLEGAREWAVSRQRYWGAPLPIWRNLETKAYKVFGSLAELQEFVPKSKNRYLITRHGESVLNTKGLLNVDPTVDNGVTEKGKEQIKALVEKLHSEEIDLIYYSPLQRTAETAKLIASGLGLSPEALVVDDRLLEMGFGEFEGKPVTEYLAFFGDGLGRMTKRPEGGENWADVKRRVGAFLYEMETKHEGKNILIVSHNGTMQMLQAAANGDTKEQAGHLVERDHYDLMNGECQELPFTPMPHNDDYELDFHRPYIDDFVVYEDGVQLERVPDVFDCWFESGAMPYGQYHYPFEHTDEFEQQLFPAEFIAEGLDQTRGWFYSLLVLGVALFDKSPYENVIVNGLALAEDGRKMSKSLQNYPDPMELVDRQGADAMRFYLLSSPIVKGEDLNFSEKEVQELQRKNIGRLHNVLSMYEMYADGTAVSGDSDYVLDRWIMTRCHQLVTEVTIGYRNYELDKATRPITDFIDDLSVWYLRRSRDRLKGEDVADKEQALATLRLTLRTLALTMAPAMPFYAEHLWQSVRSEYDAKSVHLAAWPEAEKVDEALLAAMRHARETVTAALEARTKAGLKVRQPIASVTGPLLADDLKVVVLDEVNAKEYVVEEGMVGIDTELTPELLAEGAVRELMRAVQERRKAEGLAPKDRIALSLHTDTLGQFAVESHKDLLMKTVGAFELNFTETAETVVVAGDYRFEFDVRSV